MGKNAGRFHPSEKYGFEVSLSHVSFQFAMTTPRVSSLGCLELFQWSTVAAADLYCWMYRIWCSMGLSDLEILSMFGGRATLLGSHKIVDSAISWLTGVPR